MTNPPRPIIIHSFAHARSALGAAAEIDCAVHLLSAPGAAGNMGARVFGEMMAQARAAFPQVDVTATLDCADGPGMVMNGLRMGIKSLIFTGPADVRVKLESQAEKTGASIVPRPQDPLDLLNATAPAQACRKWLGAA